MKTIEFNTYLSTELFLKFFSTLPEFEYTDDYFALSRYFYKSNIFDMNYFLPVIVRYFELNLKNYLVNTQSIIETVHLLHAIEIHLSQFNENKIYLQNARLFLGLYMSSTNSVMSGISYQVIPVKLRTALTGCDSLFYYSSKKLRDCYFFSIYKNKTPKVYNLYITS